MDVPSHREPLPSRSISPLFFPLDPWSNPFDVFLLQRMTMMMMMMRMVELMTVWLSAEVEEVKKVL
jgi:hypothetical protein